jgi:putative transposase
VAVNLVNICCTHEHYYDIIWSMSQDYRHTHTSVSLINYHFVWIPRRRRKILRGFVAERLETLIYQYAESIDCSIVSLAIEIDHVHLFLNAPTTLAPDQIMHRIKGPTARSLRAEFEQLRRMPSMWTRSYFVSTAGNVSAETIKRYIENQGKR